MPFKDPTVRAQYMRDYHETHTTYLPTIEQETWYRKNRILSRAIANGRLPTNASIRRYGISPDELWPIHLHTTLGLTGSAISQTTLDVASRWIHDKGRLTGHALTVQEMINNHICTSIYVTDMVVYHFCTSIYVTEMINNHICNIDAGTEAVTAEQLAIRF